MIIHTMTHKTIQLWLQTLRLSEVISNVSSALGEVFDCPLKFLQLFFH